MKERDIVQQVRGERIANAEHADYFEAVMDAFRNKINQEGNNFVNVGGFGSRFIHCGRYVHAYDDRHAEIFYTQEFTPGSTTTVVLRILGKIAPYSSKSEPEYIFVGRNLNLGFPGRPNIELLNSSNAVVEEAPPKQRRWIGEYSVEEGDVLEGLSRLFSEISQWEPYPYRVIESKFSKGSITTYLDVAPGKYLSYSKPLDK
ncbi:MAG: hypothetical protein A2798_01645 [Candidatus Levybacteria bacterium RIFCSPHIGHO2_01_FULL_37_17]|nr:MAG: hypothetical protein A2798_01645 [Candidatus Levybacteria bacterium RIFCSPHIGHO2_01_FULL_37_17]OGH37152.1 MAG: hypothetical protein A2959_02505 [Candidatus Levybacteria bacterium RIFCSPLOWO2_01_FULL_38_23]